MMPPATGHLAPAKTGITTFKLVTIEEAYATAAVAQSKGIPVHVINKDKDVPN